MITRGAEGDVERLPERAREIAAEQADIVIAVGLLATGAMLAAAPATPILMSFAGDDPIEAGYARSFARPAGRVTGIFFRAVESDAKRLALLAEAMPRARRLGFLAGTTLEPSRVELLAQTAAELGIELRRAPCTTAPLCRSVRHVQVGRGRRRSDPGHDLVRWRRVDSLAHCRRPRFGDDLRVGLVSRARAASSASARIFCRSVAAPATMSRAS